MLNRRGFVSCAICTAAGLVAASVEADGQGTPGLTRTILQKTAYPGDRYMTLLVSVEIEPNAQVARHIHPGVEFKLPDFRGLRSIYEWAARPFPEGG